MFEELKPIARVAKTHGKKGEVVCVPADGLPLLLHSGMQICVLPPELKGDRWYTVQAVSDNSSGQLVRFVEVETMSHAEELVGKTLMAHVKDLPQDMDFQDPYMLIGKEVYDEHAGYLGMIEEIMRGPSQDIWVIRGPFDEVLLPAVEEFVLGFDEQGALHVNAPNGLIEY
ncbi:ribosome maturation factor RimM [Atopobium fossor]|uniref:ribosome maturation factor RimM n=1 Tax=Atopobium fossor TaxID=39487 RepID=UPI0004186B58|nr:hypothetical protein [Atopobium fossor]